jgi:predicted enzyme related to lactoylglutathione lyase
MPAPVTHFEIMLKDAAKGGEFYQSLFGWKVTTVPAMNYGMVETGVQMGINGGMGQVDPNGRPAVLFYAQVEDIEGKLNDAVKRGGSVVVPVTEVPGMVTFAQFADPEGNVIGLVKGPETPPVSPETRRRAPGRPTAPRKAAPKKAAPKKAAPKKKVLARKKVRAKAKIKKVPRRKR